MGGGEVWVLEVTFDLRRVDWFDLELWVDPADSITEMSESNNHAVLTRGKTDVALVDSNYGGHNIFLNFDLNKPAIDVDGVITKLGVEVRYIVGLKHYEADYISHFVWNAAHTQDGQNVAICQPNNQTLCKCFDKACREIAVNTMTFRCGVSVPDTWGPLCTDLVRFVSVCVCV